MKRKSEIPGRVMKALASFTVSYAFVIIAYVLISCMGVFDPIDNQMALELMCVCLVIAVIHFILGFFETAFSPCFFLLNFGVVVAVVLFMGIVVFDFLVMNIVFFACLAVMLVAVLTGTYLIAYFEDWKKVQEINRMIRKNKEQSVPEK